ncbi:hypothetical protein KC887_01915 [Candidatus Kaiserbacteria bacterium]|nr:hypothetical protein [Candidatus Kaiserbacteria bacterium]
MNWRNYTFIGVLLGIGYVIQPLWFMGIVGVSWLLYTITLKHSISFKAGWYIWTVKTFFVFAWIWQTYPVDWGGISPALSGVLIFSYWTLTALSFGAAGGLLVVVYKLVRRYGLLQWWLVLAPLTWLLADLLGSILFSLVMSGSGGGINNNMSMGYIGYLLAGHQWLILVASVGGVYALDVVAVSFGALVIFLYKRFGIQAVIISFGIVMVSNFVPVPSSHRSQTYQVATINTTINEQNWQTAATTTRTALYEAFAVAKSTGAEYIIFPEDSRVFNHDLPESTLRALLIFENTNTDAVFVESARTEISKGSVVRAVVFDAKTGALATTDKRYLVPQGEYLSYIYSLPLGWLRGRDTSLFVADRFGYVLGEQTSQAQFTDSMPAVLFCFESVDARGVRKILQERTTAAPFVAHIISHAWTHDGRLVRQQLTNMLRVQALWNRIDIVVAGNYAPSEVIFASGQVAYPEIVARGEVWNVALTSLPVRSH